VRPRFVVLAAAIVAGTIVPGNALADDGDATHLGAAPVVVGQQSVLTLDVVTDPSATVEVDPSAASWQGVEVVRLGKETTSTAGGRTVHHLELVVAGFVPGSQAFSPAVNVATSGTVTARTLPPVSWTVVATLGPNDPLELSPLTPPTAVAGAESVWLRPALGFGAFLALLLGVGLTWLGAQAARRALSRRPAPVGAPLPGLPDLGPAEELIDHDPVAAYRSLAATVRGVVGGRYGFHAQALTTRELQRRMEGEGVERWQARLVGGLLEECDAVVYAGYRPAAERRLHDLTMAREIVEATV